MIFDIFSYGLLIYDVNIMMHENVNDCNCTEKDCILCPCFEFQRFVK